MATPDHVSIAESLGYRRAWFYDSPAIYSDVWMTLGRAAERTSTIGLGPGVVVPSLRHPMVTATAISTLVDLAGAERVAVAVGAGFTGRFTLGQKPLRWSFVTEYVRAVKALLLGELVEWEDAKMQMIQPAGFGAPRPLNVPFLIGAAGPRGVAAAKEVGDGVFMAAAAPEFAWRAALLSGTVLGDGEDVSSERVLAAAGPSVAPIYHAWSEFGRDLNDLPNGPAWEAAYSDIPADVRHLSIHDGHLIAVNDRDRPFITPEFLASRGVAFTPAEIRARLVEMEATGLTEIVYQPAGPDIPRELEAFASAVRR